MSKVLECSLEVNNFDPLVYYVHIRPLSYYVHIRTHTLEKDMDPLSH